MADRAGTLAFVDIVEDLTLREEYNESTGRRQRMIIEDRDKRRHPSIQILTDQGDVKEFIMPVGTQLGHIPGKDGQEVEVSHGARVQPGDKFAKISRDVYKTRDITGGLPRITELFEARVPKDPAMITEIDGTVSFGKIKRGKREVFVTPRPREQRIYKSTAQKQAKKKVYDIPVGKHLRVHHGDLVKAGDRLSEGPINPHDILDIQGPNRVQEYLLNEVQEVYRLQGVKINDKHIGVIVRQMLQKVRVVDPGETPLLEDQRIDRVDFRELNQRAIAEGKKPARAKPVLLGITKASLTTESFVSAASFQETTRVLTNAAVRGARDDLKGLKENIIIGHLIPAGTGVHRWHDVEFKVEQSYYDEEILPLTAPGEILPGLSEIPESLGAEIGLPASAGHALAEEEAPAANVVEDDPEGSAAPSSEEKEVVPVE